jgi:crotonobetainyl-CoA:carnitine CoA-transferase CaiB-like acyl-CoA transferase
MNAPLRDSESDNPHAAQALPLAGMKVLDLSRALSGPFCSMILGDLGADVVKVEPMPKGDMIRTWGPFDRDQSAYFLSGNRNKRAIAIDFRTPDGIAILRELALKSDVIVENFLPGTLEAMTLGADRLRAEKPAIIVASISGFGKGGPLGDRPGFDQIAQGFSGFMSVTGTAETGPTRVGVAIGDMASGMWLAIGVLGAWIERGRSGCGQTVETSLLASLIGLLSVQGQRYLSLGEVASPSGNVHPVIAPYGVFRAADGDMNIGAATQDMWLKLCDVLERPDLKADPRFTLNADRMGHRDALRDIIETELARRRPAGRASAPPGADRDGGAPDARPFAAGQQPPEDGRRRRRLGPHSAPAVRPAYGRGAGGIRLFRRSARRLARPQADLPGLSR